MTRRIVASTPEDRIALAKTRLWETVAGIAALLYAALIVGAIAGAIWLLAGFWGR